MIERFDDRSYTRPSPASPGGSKVTYVVTITEWDSRVGDGLGTRLAQVYIGCVNSVGNHNFTLK